MMLVIGQMDLVRVSLNYPVASEGIRCGRARGPCSRPTPWPGRVDGRPPPAPPSPLPSVTYRRLQLFVRRYPPVERLCGLRLALRLARVVLGGEVGGQVGVRPRPARTQRRRHVGTAARRRSASSTCFRHFLEGRAP